MNLHLFDTFLHETKEFDIKKCHSAQLISRFARHRDYKNVISIPRHMSRFHDYEIYRDWNL